MVNKSKVMKRVLASWFHTLVSFFVMAISISILIAVSSRFGGGRAVVGIVMTMAGVAIASFLLSEVIVCLIFRAKKPSEAEHQHFFSSVEELCSSRGMWFRPRLYILHGEKPNACAFGWGFFGQYAIGITEELYRLLSPIELKGVLAHELAHIRCKDVGMMTALVLVTGSAEKLANLFLKGKTALGKGPFALFFGWVLLLLVKFIFPVGRSAISQERERSADALGAFYIGSPEPLISALKKLQKAMSTGDNKEKSVIEELFLSHPKMNQRIALLKDLSI
jgi:heat shock protein HtpX